MGEAKRRKQLLGTAYGTSTVQLEKCTVPKEITFAYVDDSQIQNNKENLSKLPDDFKSVLFNTLVKAQESSEPGIVFAEDLKFSGQDGVEVTFRNDVETFIKSRCNVRSQAPKLMETLETVDYSTHRIVAILSGNKTPRLDINVYTLSQIETLLEHIKQDIEKT
ncbi:MAG: DUF2839 domain-containing protein [Scytonematopsis contorta HA4267-MV1]|jgi:hypothetical protein|nr:DUF2839 domain-containing protein [Scytonematopsis contorta HA4267-MV1]